MQEELHDQGLLGPWTDPVSNSYSDIPLDESAPDLLASDSPQPSPVHDHLHHHQQQHLSHLQQQQLQQQNQHCVTSTPLAFVTHPLPSYNNIPEAETVGHFDYANEAPSLLIRQPQVEMRTGPGGGGRVEEGGSVKRGWKRKRDDRDDDVHQQMKLDSNQRCDVCGEQASGHYFGALVCLPCKSFFIRCTKDGRPNFSNQCGGKCDVLKGGRVRCQHCRFQKCISAGMFRKEKPEAVEPAEGQLLCKVCGDIANGVHFGVTTCEGCKKFFRRGLKENRSYTCKGHMRCSINPRMRNNCRYCRYQKCLYEGMSREAIKMGRPKKGELSYRKPAKKNGLKPNLKPYDKQMIGSNRSSMSSEFDQDEVSTSDDVFDHVVSQHQLHPNHQQMSVSGQMHSNQQQMHSNQQQPHHHQQQQQGGFNLGSLLHDCMTVQDWDQKVELTELDQSSHPSSSSHSVMMVPPSSGIASLSGSHSEDGRQVSPHMRHTSPTMHSDMLSLQQQHNQQIQLQHQQQQSQQHIEMVDQLHVSMQQHQPQHRMESYQNHGQTADDVEVMGGMDFPEDHSLPINRAIKVENTLIRDGSGVGYSEGAVLEDMKNLQGIKADFPTYQLQASDPMSSYTGSEQRPVPVSVGNANIVPISQLEPSVSSQIVAINMSSHDINYTPHSHVSFITSPNHHQPKYSFTRDQQGAEQSHVDSDQGIPDLIQGRDREGLKFDNRLTPNGEPNLITNQNITSSESQEQSVSMASRNAAFNDMNTSMQRHHQQQHQQFGSNSNSLSPSNSNSPSVVSSPRPRTPRNVKNESNFTFISSSSQQNIASLLPSLCGSLQTINSAHLKNSGIRSPIAALLQQHREAIQAGKPAQLSSNELEELINTLSAEQGRSRFLGNEQASPKSPRNVADQNFVDTRRQMVGNFVMDNEGNKQQLDTSVQLNRQTTTPISVIHYQNESSVSQYQNDNPTNQNVPRVPSRQYRNQASPISDSSSSDRQDYSRGYISAAMSNNNLNNNNNNNGSSQSGHFMSSPLPSHHSNHSAENGQDEEVFDDSFNSSLIRDSTLLHEINRIFLGIDNACDTYGCNRGSESDEDNRLENRMIASTMSQDEFSPEISHKYWHSFVPSGQYLAITQERHKIIQDVLDAFDNLRQTYVSNEPEHVSKKLSHDQIEHWHHIQRRIARHVVAGQRFCRNIPGYFKLDIQDRISLGKHVGFGLMVLIACTDFYDPEFKKFRYIWNWTMPMQNPLFSYKVHLLSLGDMIHEIQVDRIEASMLCAISMTSIDCPGLLKPQIVCDVRDGLIDALEAHITAKKESSQRLRRLLSIMPQVRLMTVWYNNLMKKMSLPSDIINSKINKLRPREAKGSENTPTFH